MARFTTDFLTWLKGLFYTETEVDTLLDKKINTVDVQAKVTQFTNKDRINIERLINYMDNGSGNNYYTLTLKAGAYAGWTEDNYNNSTTGNLGVNNASANTSPSVCCFAVDIKKNGTIQKNSSIPVVLKNTDGTKIFDFVADNFNWTSVRKESIQVRDVFGSTPGIHYVYAEATISGSVYKSNIIGVFVKDNTNKVDYNVWSCGEYTKDNTNFGMGSEALTVVSNEWSNIGEYSLKVTRKHQLYGTSVFTRLSNLTGTNNINATVKIYTPNNPVRIELFNGESLIQVVCPASSTVNNINLNKTINLEYIDLRFFLYEPEDYVFIDDIKITY